MLGATVIPATSGSETFKDATNERFVIGSIIQAMRLYHQDLFVGRIRIWWRDFQSVISRRSLPVCGTLGSQTEGSGQTVVACVGGTEATQPELYCHFLGDFESTIDRSGSSRSRSLIAACGAATTPVGEHPVYSMAAEPGGAEQKTARWSNRTVFRRGSIIGVGLCMPFFIETGRANSPQAQQTMRHWLPRVQAGRVGEALFLHWNRPMRWHWTSWS